MKKFIWIKIFLSFACLYGLAYAEGPVFSSSDTYTQQEFDNVYSDLRKVSAAQKLTTNTSGQMLIGQGNGINPIWVSGGRLLQPPVFVSVNTSSTTTSTSFINTTLSAPITPVASNSQIIILASGNIGHSASGFSGVATISRGDTNLSPDTDGFCESAFTATGWAQNNTPCTMFWKEAAPLSGSATTYFVQIKTKSGAGTTGWSNGNVTASQMIIFEIGQ